MYIFFGILFCVILIFICINHWKRKRIIHKVCCMCPVDKCQLLNELAEPFGYSYYPKQDIFSTRIDAWQRKFGYCALYDKTAAAFNMVFDCLPVYFDYRGRTWLIEFWKGQYGINTGCEIGVYYADGIVDEAQWEHTLFDCVDDEDMQKLSLTLFKKGDRLARLCERHWWLTAFIPGRFSEPSGLFMDVSLTFADDEMAKAFVKGLIKAGYDQDDIWMYNGMVSFSFIKRTVRYNIFRKLQRRLAQSVNHFWCRVFVTVTRPFQLSGDRVIYLYFYFPFAFRRLFRMKRIKKRR